MNKNFVSTMNKNNIINYCWTKLLSIVAYCFPPPKKNFNFLPAMNKNIWRRILDVTITILTAIAAALTATSCAHGVPFNF